MVAKKAAAKKTEAIQKMDTSILTDAFHLGTQLFKTIATALSSKLEPETVYAIHSQLEAWSKVAENLHDNTKERLTKWVEEHGKETTEKGSMMARLPDGTELGIRPWRTTLDPKKFETMLRAKGLEPSEHMGKKVTYEVDPDLVISAVGKELITPDEVENCKYKLTWVLVKPK